MDSVTNNRWGVIFINIILFVCQFDTFDFINEGGLGAISPFRVIVLPLCLYYFLFANKKSQFQNGGKIALLILFFIFCIVGDVGSERSNMGSMIGNIVMLFFSYLIFNKISLHRSSLYVITTWAFIQIPIFISQFRDGMINIAFRFEGLHFDPNYLCALVIPAIWASVFLLKSESQKILKGYNYLVIVFGVLMVFFSYSRGGLLALLFTLFLYLLVYNKKIAVVTLVIGISLFSGMMLRSKFLTYADATSNFVDGFIYRNFTLSEDISDFTSGRSDLFMAFVDEIREGRYILIGSSLSQYMHDVNNDFNSHNGFVDLCAQGGLIVGGLFCILLMYCFVCCILYTIKLKKIPYELLFALSIFIPMLFLAFSAKIAWFVFGLIISMSNKRNYKRLLCPL